MRRMGLLNASALLDALATELARTSSVSRLAILADAAIWAGTSGDPDEIGELVE